MATLSGPELERCQRSPGTPASRSAQRPKSIGQIDHSAIRYREHTGSTLSAMVPESVCPFARTLRPIICQSTSPTSRERRLYLHRQTRWLFRMQDAGPLGTLTQCECEWSPGSPASPDFTQLVITRFPPCRTTFVSYLGGTTIVKSFEFLISSW